MAPSRRLPRPGTAVLSLVAVCVFAGAAPGVAAQEAPRKWLISLSPAQKKVYYTGLPMFTEATDLIKIHQAPNAKTPPAQQPALISEAPNILVSDLAEPRAIALHTAAIFLWYIGGHSSAIFCWTSGLVQTLVFFYAKMVTK